jgi:catechol 2,3-dioxygenase-like lactoylglutathione lyase family enzyme
MIAGGSARLLVTEMDRAVRFYVETLGFKLRARSGDEWAEVDAGGGLLLGLQRRAPGEALAGARGSICVGFDLNQPIAEVVEVLANRGVEFLGPTKEEGGTSLSFFVDPDRNALCLVEARPPRVAFAEGKPGRR